MPNPKLGTVTADVAGAIKAVKGGQVEFRVEKAGIVHAGVGKTSFGEDALMANIRAFVDAIARAKPSGAKGTYIKRISLSSTMGSGVRVEVGSIQALPAGAPHTRVSRRSPPQGAGRARRSGQHPGLTGRSARQRVFRPFSSSSSCGGGQPGVGRRRKLPSDLSETAGAAARPAFGSVRRGLSHVRACIDGSNGFLGSQAGTMRLELPGQASRTTGSFACGPR